jgi:guanosine-3',5'-bis(diphosphate) 3'-pyrophosphohydrolase
MVVETPRKFFMTAEELIKCTEEYLLPEDLDLFKRACSYASACYTDQVQYTFGVTNILVDLHLDLLTIFATLVWHLPSLIEIIVDDSRRLFRGEVLELVEEVQQLGRLEWNDWSTVPEHNEPPNRKEILQKMFLLAIDETHTGESVRNSTLMTHLQKREKQVENLMRMFLATPDIRALIIKLADRLHFTRLLNHNALPLFFQQEGINYTLFAKISLAIYAPLADRLGMWQLKSELEDMSFRFLQPDKFKTIANQLAVKKEEREQSITQIIPILQEVLKEFGGIKARITGRAKHIYSIYQKMEAKELTFEEINDLLGVRIIVKTKEDCYAAQGILHGFWAPITSVYGGKAGRDWIANPKPNQYQSLHTTIQIEDKIVEVQIRTDEMHEVAEYGITAAHWRYKEDKIYRKGKTPKETRTKDQRWDEQLAELRKSLAEYGATDSIQRDVLKGWIFVITPEGHIIDLRAGATPLDFAYRIHTDLGNRYAGAKVGGRVVRLDYKLKNGEIVELLPPRRRTMGPNPDWLSQTKDERGDRYYPYAQIPQARGKIRHWLSTHQENKPLSKHLQPPSKQVGGGDTEQGKNKNTPKTKQE